MKQDLERLDLADESFDMTFNEGVVEHLIDRNREFVLLVKWLGLRRKVIQLSYMSLMAEICYIPGRNSLNILPILNYRKRYVLI